MATNEHYALQAFAIALYNQSVDDGQFVSETEKLYQFLIEGTWGEGNKLTDDFHLSCEIDSETPRTIAFTEVKSGKRRVLKPSKWIQYLDRQFSLGLEPRAIEYMATTIGEILPLKWGFDYEIVSGKDIVDAYNITHSCMTRNPTLEWYADNPEVVSLVKVLKDGQPVARALLWELEDGSKYLDRIYPNSGGWVEELLKYAQKQGWRTRPDQRRPGQTNSNKDNIPFTAPLKHPRNDGASAQNSMGPFPYLDTFNFMRHDKEKKTLQLAQRGADGFVKVASAANAYRNMFFCELSNGWYPTDLRYSGYVHRRDGSSQKITARIDLIKAGNDRLQMVEGSLYETGHPEIVKYKGGWALRRNIVTPAGFSEGVQFHVNECIQLKDGNFFPADKIGELVYRNGGWAFSEERIR